MARVGVRVNTVLRASTALTALVSTRVRPDLMDPADGLPAVRFTQISQVPERAHTADTGHSRIRMQVDSFATTRAGADAVAALVKTALNGYNSSTDVVWSYFDSERSLIDPDFNIRRTQQDFLIHHKE